MERKVPKYEFLNIIIRNNFSFPFHSFYSSTCNNEIKFPYQTLSLQLALYRHWTVEASLRHSMYPAVKLKLWTLRGEKRLQELLAEMGCVFYSFMYELYKFNNKK